MGEHALLSASSAHRWLKCSPSVRLEEEVEDNTSIYAKEGTFMHGLAELHLKLFLDDITKAEFNKELKEMKKNDFYTDEIKKAVEIYVDAVIEKINEARANTSDSLILIEERLDYSPWVNEGFGTGDVLIIADGIIEVIDLKGGKGVAVSAIGNPQMRLYALGAINGFGMLYDTQKVRMTIIQPRIDNISSDEMEVEELINWGKKIVKPKADEAWAGKGEFKVGGHCRFCKVKAICRARAEENMKMAQYDFRKGPLLTDDEITEILSGIDELQKWTNDIQAYALDKAVNENKKWDGFKLVEGRSSRKYSNEQAVARTLIDAGFEEEDIYSKNLLGITAMEKAMGKKKFKELLNNLVYKPQGKLTLVVESDKRPEIKNTAELDFK